MVREALVTSGVSYHHGIVQSGAPLAGFETIDMGRLAETNLNEYDLLIVPRSSDGEILRARRYQFARYLDNGGVLIALGELWANWFPGCRWEEECAEDILAPVVSADHPLTSGYSANDLHWHPAKERWCCHGHLVAPDGAEVPIQNTRGDAWLYIDRRTTNGVILAASNMDVDTHSFHGSGVAQRFFNELLERARSEAARAPVRREGMPRKIAGLYSGVHFQRAFYEDQEFFPWFAVLPVWELEATNLHDYAALWIPRESNQRELVRNRGKLTSYLNEGGNIVCFEEVNQPWLPVGRWTQLRANMDTIHLTDHPLITGLTAEQVSWHSHGVYEPYENADVLIEDDNGHVMLFMDERTFTGQLLAGTMDPDCHAGFGTETTRPLLRAILSWVASAQRSPVGVS